MKRQFYILVILALFTPMFVLAQQQNEKLKELIKLKDRFLKEEKYDSLLMICKKIKDLDLKAAIVEKANFYMAEAYYKSGEYDQAIKYTKRFLRRPTIKELSPYFYKQNMDKRELSYNMYNIYMSRLDYKHAIKCLEKINKKYDNFNIEVGRRNWRIQLYENMIYCYNQLGEEKMAQVYTAKHDKLKRGI